MEQKISIKLAKEISLKKWNAELEGTPYESSLKEEYPELDLFDYFYCGFCYRHRYSYRSDIELCENCELSKTDALGCTEVKSLYNRIVDYDEDNETVNRRTLIKELIEIIENIPEDEE